MVETCQEYTLVLDYKINTGSASAWNILKAYERFPGCVDGCDDAVVQATWIFLQIIHGIMKMWCVFQIIRNQGCAVMSVSLYLKETWIA